MADTLTKDQRRKNMKAIKSQSKLENAVSKELWNKGIRFRKNSRGLFGKPDISIKKYKIVIFIDSCFWHCCPVHGNMPKSNKDFWEEKLKRNVERDKEVTTYYKDRGWNILRVWEHEIKNDFDDTMNRIYQFILSSQAPTG
ncbi:very short patch repair endonuclease [Alteribacter keqinensis]|uniref:Very short patch repair endonuclease n=1 Tax=Alteribacter keqinensis TaxID=2483800 RepID=A0A3M7TXN0_9BACI|nr:very short patch repair endonuclease [Alteribacter keqinensis]RNA70029.1 very short patch repair endonuclease [Alteribacter keqinensis]